jgi:membrane protein YdbS with pleckstrin-like domain
MSNNIDLKKIWGLQQTDIPNTKEIFELAHKYRNKRLKGIIISNILLLLTSAFIAMVWYRYQPEMMTTKTGIVLVILAMLIYLFVYNRMIPLLVKSGYDMSSSMYMAQLLKLKEKQRYMQTTMLNIYFVLLSIGIALYMIEYVSRMTVLWGLCTYGVTFLWILVNWIVFRPRTIRKQQKGINELIIKFEDLNRQLGSGD